MRLRAIVRSGVLLTLAALAAAYLLSAPDTLPASVLTPRLANAANGEYIFNASGCANCHATEGQKDRLRLGGGHSLKSPFGAFKVPNISSDPKAGIGAWTELQFVNAMLAGVGPAGEHLFPSFPYTSYQRMALDDVRDLFAYMKTLPPDPRASEPHLVVFPFNIRRAVGLWKRLFFERERPSQTSAGSTGPDRGAYLVEGPGHCAECHSGRSLLGAVVGEKRFAGGRVPGGRGWIPNITPHKDGLADWSTQDWEFLLETGFTPDGIAVGSEMAEVIRGTSKLTAADRKAMAAYLRALPPRPGRKPPAEKRAGE